MSRIVTKSRKRRVICSYGESDDEGVLIKHLGCRSFSRSIAGIVFNSFDSPFSKKRL